MRTFGTIQFSLNMLAALGFDQQVVDQYYTIIGYFNALKNLGSSAYLIRDRVPLYAESLLLHKFAVDAQMAGLQRIAPIRADCELTSRKSAQEIKEALEEMEVSYPDERAYAYVLASNMMSVGIDIDRLGLMTVYNQPKSSSEYIQATSRVGRRYPGLVIALFQGQRTRDRLHFEQFQGFHRRFYRQVESSSVTPYSRRALDKALHAVFVAIVRHRCPMLCGNKSAGQFRSRLPEVRAIRERILARVREIAPEAEGYASESLDDFISCWANLAREKGLTLWYSVSKYQQAKASPLLLAAESQERCRSSHHAQLDAQRGRPVKRLSRQALRRQSL